MTRIRFPEWLFAIVLVVAIHGLALTGWSLVAPGDPGGVRLPPKTAAQPQEAADALPLVVTVVGDDEKSVDTIPRTAGQTPAGSSNEIIVVPTQPAVSSGSGASTVVLAPPEITPPPPVVMPIEDAAPADASAPAGDSAPADDAAPAAAPEPMPTTALTLPTLDFPTGDAPADDGAAAPGEERTSLRDPVPTPKPKPITIVPPEPPVVDAPASDSPGSVAAAQPESRTGAGTAEAPDSFSAAQSVYYRRLLAEVKKAQVYPPVARQANMTGTVYLQIVVERSGRIKSYDIVKSSGFQELDDAAVQTLVRANPVSPFPDDITDSELRFGLPMRFGS